MSEHAELATHGLGVNVGGAALLRGVSTTLSQGELVAIGGPSGVGKSTLLRVIAGLVPASAGDVLWRGKPLTEVGAPLFRRNVVYVSQQPALLDGTVEYNLRRPFEYAVDQRVYDRDKAAVLLERLSVEPDRLNQSASTLSIGQQQRLALVRALQLESPVLLLDEPTSALDEASRDAVEDLLREQADSRGLAAFIVSHDRAQIERLCDREVNLSPFAARGAE